MVDPTKRFRNRVEDYIKYRPRYAQEAIHFILETSNLKQGANIADIGSGTGILTQEWIKRGFKTYAVEPNPKMREAAEHTISSDLFISIDGTAENTTLPDNSIDLITAAQAFHWFDKRKAKKEFKRILKSEGWIALLWNERRKDTPFLKEFEKFIINNSTDYKKVNHVTTASDEVVLDFLGDDTLHRVFEVAQTFDFEGLFGRYASSSYAFHKGTEVFDQARKNLKRIFDKFQSNGKIDVLYFNHVYLTKWTQTT